MSTYGDLARDKELAAQRKGQDAILARRHRQFNNEVADNTDKRGGWKGMKFERPSFIVVTASEAYRKGWERTFSESSKLEVRSRPEQLVLEKSTASRETAP